MLGIVALLNKSESTHYLIVAVAPTRAQAYISVVICVDLLRGLLLLCAYVLWLNDEGEST